MALVVVCSALPDCAGLAGAVLHQPRLVAAVPCWPRRELQDIGRLTAPAKLVTVRQRARTCLTVLSLAGAEVALQTCLARHS